MHNINSMMYVGETPWHGLGTPLQNVATAAEAIVAAGLDWHVSKEPIFLGGSTTPIPNKFATVRDDVRAPLGVVGRRYEPFQNKSAFSFFDAVVGSKEAIYHTSGALGKGQKVWILAKLPGIVRVTDLDVTEKFLLLTNSHDGTSGIEIMFTPIRVVCQNTLNVALTNSFRKQTLRHTSQVGLKVRDVREGLGIVNQQFAFFEEAAQRLASVQINQATWTKYLEVLGIKPVENDEASKTLGSRRAESRAAAIIEDVTKRFEHGKGNDLPGVKGTAWAAFNAITEYVDYGRSTKGDKAEGRANSLLFGSGRDLKQKAFDLALTIAK